MLVVDDVEANLVAFEALLDGLPCRVVRATSGQEALQQLLRTAFAVMLLDVQMPNMDGFEVAALARGSALTRSVPIIFVTAAHSSDEFSLRGYGSGAVDFMFKPIVREVLRSKVSVFLELYVARQGLTTANALLERQNRDLLALAQEEVLISNQLRASHADLQHAYADLQRTQTQLVQAARAASVAELISGFSGEIDGPLASTFTQLSAARQLLDGLSGSLGKGEAGGELEQARLGVGESLAGLERVREAVDKLLALTRLDTAQRAPASVSSCIDSVLGIVAPRLGRRIKLDVLLTPPETIECYPALLGQLVLNLVSNAVDAIDGEGVISIRAGRADGAYVLSVSDTGGGIAEGLRDRVMEPFFTTKRGGQATGLGLAIAQSIVAKHEGSLTFEQGPAGGTTFTVQLPLR